MDRDVEKLSLDTASSDRDQAPTTPVPETGLGAAPAAAAPASESAPAQQPASDIPDGGLQAWLQVFGSFAVMVATWGLVNSFGVFQTYYETTLLAGRSTSSEISWIGSIQASLLLMLGLVSGPLYDAGLFSATITVGLALVVLGMFMTSLATAYWHLVLAQGVCVGVGMGLSFLPSTAVLAQYFSRRRALALGIASAGSPLAGIVFPIVFARLEGSIGFGWATRTIAFIVLASSAVPVAFMRVRVLPTRKRALFDPTAVVDPPFMLFAVASFAAFLVLYVPFFYTQLYTIAHGIADDGFAPYLVTFLNVGSVFGRVIPGALADRYGSLNMLMFCTVASAILAFGWIGTQNLGGLTVFALLYGAFSGGVVALSPSVIVTLSPDMNRVGARMGMSFTFMGVAVLVGTPIAGAILGQSAWVPMMLFTALFLTGALLLYVAARYLVFKRKGGVVA